MNYSDAELFLIREARERLASVSGEEVAAIRDRLQAIGVRETLDRARADRARRERTQEALERARALAERQERLRECGVTVK